jgi:hypothetical protein
MERTLQAGVSLLRKHYTKLITNAAVNIPSINRFMTKRKSNLMLTANRQNRL